MRKVSLTAISLTLLCLLSILWFPSVTLARQGPPVKKITIPPGVTTLHRLVQQMQKQSGLDLDVDAKDPLSGTPLMAAISETRIDTVASALASLLSAKHAPWRWERRDGRPGEGSSIPPAEFKTGVAYRLRPSSAARAYVTKKRAIISQELVGVIATVGTENGTALPDYGTLVKALQQSVTLSPKLPNDRPPSQTELERFADARAKQDALLRQLAQITLTQLSPAERKLLTQGDTRHIPASSLSNESATAVRTAATLRFSEQRTYGAGPDGGKIELSMIGQPKDSLIVSTQRAAFDVVPTLSVSINRFASYGYDNLIKAASGGGTPIETVGASAEKPWRERLTGEWFIDDVPSTEPLDTLVLPELGTQTPSTHFAEDDLTDAFSAPLLEMVAAARKQNKPLNVLARLSVFQRGVSSPFAGIKAKSIAEARQALARERNMATRWFKPIGEQDNPVLLANALPGLWTETPEQLVTPSIRKEYFTLRRSNPNGFLSLDNLCELAHRLSADALFRLLNTTEEPDEVPDGKSALPVPTQLGNFVRMHYRLLNYLGRHPAVRQQMQSVDGLDMATTDSDLKEALWRNRPSLIPFARARKT